MPLTVSAGAPGYFSFGYTNKAWQDGLDIPVSHGTAGGPDQIWTGIPWDAEYVDGQDVHSPGGWTILMGPCLVTGVAFLRVMHQDEGSSLHLMPRVAKRIDGVNVIQRSLEATEWGVLPNEVHISGGVTTYSNTHLCVPFAGQLGEDERLQIFVDCWNSEITPVAVGGSVSGLYFPRPWDPPAATS